MNEIPEPTIGLIVQHVKKPELSFKVIEIHRSSIDNKDGIKTFIDLIKVIRLDIDGSEIDQMNSTEFTHDFWSAQFNNGNLELK